MKRVLIPGVILCGADVAQAVDDKNMYMHFFEEMTVYAPVPVPVNGNTHYTSESIAFTDREWQYQRSAENQPCGTHGFNAKYLVEPGRYSP
ncbi:hypothetical protein VEGS09_22680 [Escherichia coli]|nr:hypothetical protein VEGS09_22680 [Escherichia coli]BEC10086.1 hypothetical protein VEE66_22560 [Escherichia coli]